MNEDIVKTHNKQSTNPVFPHISGRENKDLPDGAPPMYSVSDPHGRRLSTISTTSAGPPAYVEGGAGYEISIISTRPLPGVSARDVQHILSGQGQRVTSEDESRSPSPGQDRSATSEEESRSPNPGQDQRVTTEEETRSSGQGHGQKVASEVESRSYSQGHGVVSSGSSSPGGVSRTGSERSQSSMTPVEHDTGTDIAGVHTTTSL